MLSTSANLILHYHLLFHISQNHHTLSKQFPPIPHKLSVLKRGLKALRNTAQDLPEASKVATKSHQHSPACIVKLPPKNTYGDAANGTSTSHYRISTYMRQQQSTSSMKPLIKTRLLQYAMKERYSRQLWASAIEKLGTMGSKVSI